jgi:hypothetical protein
MRLQAVICIGFCLFASMAVADIHAWRRIYRPKNFGFVWEGFDALIAEGRFKASIEVYNELQKKDDELFEWCKERKEGDHRDNASRSGRLG